MGVVYFARNTLNNKGYVGKTINALAERQANHEYAARSGSALVFHRAIRKYGTEAFQWEVLAESDDEARLLELECEFIASRSTKKPLGYNMTDGGEGVSGYEFSEEARANVRRSLTPERRKAISDALKGNTLSEETRKKISKAGRGKKRSAETRRKISEFRKQFRYSEESCKKIADANRGRKASEESRRKMSEAKRGAVRSAEATQKAADANRGKRRSGAALENIRAGIKRRDEARRAAALQGVTV